MENIEINSIYDMVIYNNSLGHAILKTVGFFGGWRHDVNSSILNGLHRDATVF